MARPSLSSTRQFLVGAALGASLLPFSLVSAEAAVGAAQPASPAAKPEKKPEPAKPEETLLFTTRAGQRQVLSRSDAEGGCKAYLGQPGQGWIAYPDPKTPGDDHQAVSSPDGRHIALLSSRSGSLNLWLLDAEAREWRALTDDDGGILDPADATGPVLAFSPDSKRLAVIRRGALWVMAVEGEQPRTLTLERNLRALAWSPDSRWVAYLSDRNVRKVDAAGAPDVLLSADLADQPQLVWHPDPKQDLLYFHSGGMRRVDSRRRVTLVAPSPSRPNSLALLPGGRQAAMLLPVAGGAQEVHLFNLDGKAAKPVQLTQGGAEAILASASGKSLYFMREGVAWRIDLNGSRAKPLGTVPMATVRVAQLPPLKGVCP